MRQLPSIAAMTGINLNPETEDFKNFRREVIHKLEESLLHWFSDMADDVLSACKIADFKSWPEKEEERTLGKQKWMFCLRSSRMSWKNQALTYLLLDQSGIS